MQNLFNWDFLYTVKLYNRRFRMFCRYCGSEIEETTKICPFCGKSNEKPEILSQKEKQIQILEQKVKRLEERLERNNKSTGGFFRNFNYMPLIFIVPIVFVILFFVLFFFLASL
ncbi:MAG: zinc ribbon domain-containing protein [Promethearchaeota archaeon]|jgi:uncharacterized membrane protein YvbJ